MFSKMRFCSKCQSLKSCVKDTNWIEIPNMVIMFHIYLLFLINTLIISNFWQTFQSNTVWAAACGCTVVCFFVFSGKRSIIVFFFLYYFFETVKAVLYFSIMEEVIEIKAISLWHLVTQSESFPLSLKRPWAIIGDQCTSSLGWEGKWGIPRLQDYPIIEKTFH